VTNDISLEFYWRFIFCNGMKKKIEQEEEELIEEEEKEYDLYGDLGLTSAATQQEIKSSYYRLAMKWHPDRNENNQEATEKFQSIGKAYEILSDEKKRVTKLELKRLEILRQNWKNFR
jgi:curved DNA-binding protein CbpA